MYQLSMRIMVVGVRVMIVVLRDMVVEIGIIVVVMRDMDNGLRLEVLLIVISVFNETGLAPVKFCLPFLPDDCIDGGNMAFRAGLS